MGSQTVTDGEELNRGLPESREVPFALLPDKRKLSPVLCAPACGPQISSEVSETTKLISPVPPAELTTEAELPLQVEIGFVV